MDKAARVLFADDDPDTRGIVKLVLEKAGYDVTLAVDGRQAIDLHSHILFDLFLLDICMPDLDGVELCRRIYQDTGAPVLFLTARAAEDDLLLGFAAGACDYISKPFRPKELVARIESSLRRSSRASVAAGRQLVYADLVVDTCTRQVLRAGRPLNLAPISFHLLVYFLERPGELVTKTDLLRDVWAFANPLGGQNRVEAAIKRLRRDLGDDSRSPRYIQTVWRLGYRLGGPLSLSGG